MTGKPHPKPLVIPMTTEQVAALAPLLARAEALEQQVMVPHPQAQEQAQRIAALQQIVQDYIPDRCKPPEYVDPRDQRIAELERDLTEARAEIEQRVQQERQRCLRKVRYLTIQLRPTRISVDQAIRHIESGEEV